MTFLFISLKTLKELNARLVRFYWRRVEKKWFIYTAATYTTLIKWASTQAPLLWTELRIRMREIGGQKENITIFKGPGLDIMTKLTPFLTPHPTIGHRQGIHLRRISLAHTRGGLSIISITVRAAIREPPEKYRRTMLEKSRGQRVRGAGKSSQMGTVTPLHPHPK